VGTFGDSLFRQTSAAPAWTPIDIGNPYVWSLLRSDNTLYAATDSGPYRSPDGGQSWSQWSAGLSGEGLLGNDLLVDGAGTLWLATFGGGVFQRPPGADGWSPVNNGLSGTARRVWALVLDQESHLVAATASGVYRLSQSGQWQRFGLDSLVVYALASRADGTMVAGTSAQGVFRRAVGSDSWQAINDGLPDTMEVRDLLILEACNGLFAATEDGIWKHPLP
jgi:ligand-binding sensor domain-containing protein